MKAKSRRRLLISSVAMLLVAMLALGTATFAWFTTSTTTNAKNIAVRTSKKSLLLVSSKDSEWVDQLNYNFGTASSATAVDTAFSLLTPVSSYDGVHWYDAVAKSGTDYKAYFGDVVTPSTDSGKIFYNMLNVKNDGTAETEKNVHITATLVEADANGAESSTNYLRMAIVPAKTSDGQDVHYNDSVVATGDNRSTAQVASDEEFRSNIYGKTTSETANPITGLGTAIASGDVGTSKTILGDSVQIEQDDVGRKPLEASTTAVTASKGASVNIDAGKLGAKEAKYYMLIVWFEGQDTDCKDSNAGNRMPNITFTVTEADA